MAIDAHEFSGIVVAIFLLQAWLGLLESSTAVADCLLEDAGHSRIQPRQPCFGVVDRDRLPICISRGCGEE